MRGRAVLVLALALAMGVQATFASSAGFSGRNADCTVCHAAPAPQAATAHLEVPETWSPGGTYLLEARVTGGPTPVLPFRPQGGFELEAERGHFAVAAAQADLYRVPRDGVITYEPPATSFREWTLTWQAPPPWQEPTPITFWLAAMAANGDHDPELNRSTGGERGDAVDTVSVTVPPDPEVVAAWQALPLHAPVVDRATEISGGWRIEGHHPDANATHLVVVRDEVERRVQTERAWVVQLEGSLDAVLRAEGAGRTSSEVQLSQEANQSPAPWAAVPLLAALLARRFK